MILRCLSGTNGALTPQQILDRDSDIKQAGVYVALARMRADGWLDSTKDDSTEGERGSPHRRYNINALGRRLLKMADEMEMLSGVRAYA